MSSPARLAAGSPARVFVVVFLCVALLAYVGIASRLSGVLASFWPANAVLAGLLVRAPHLRTAPGWHGAIAGYVVADVSTGTSLPGTVLLTAANLTGVLVVLGLLRRRSLEDRRVRRPSAVLRVMVTAAAGALGGTGLGIVASVQLFDMSTATAARTWFGVELGSYLTCLITVLAAPSPAEVRARVRATMALPGWLKLRRLIVRAMPPLAVATAIGVALMVGGPAAIAIPVPVLAAVALRITVFETALYALLVQASLAVAIRSGVMDVGLGEGIFGLSVEESVWVAVSLISIGPLMVAASNEQLGSRLQNLRDRVIRDPLTGGMAREAVLAQGQSVFEAVAATRGQLAVLLIDVDGFNEINERLGYPVGDAVLVETARRCRAGLRAADQFGRVGGDEFCAVVVGAPSGACAALGDQLRTLVRAGPMDVGPEDIEATISVGVAYCRAGEGAASFAEVFRQADDALREAKRSGPDQTVLTVSPRPKPPAKHVDPEHIR